MKLHGRVRASSCGAMMLSHAVRQALVEPGMAKISVRLATPATAGTTAASRCRSLRTTACGTLRQSLRPSRSNSSGASRRLVTLGEPGPAGDQHHLHVIAGDPRRHLGADGVAVFFHNRLIDDMVSRLLRRLRSQRWPEVSSSSPRRLETVRIAIRVGINSSASLAHLNAPFEND